MLRKALWIILIVNLMGCSSLFPTRSSPTAKTYNGRIVHAMEDKALANLWQQAELKRRQGYYKDAEALLIQAVEIDASDAAIWSRRAELNVLLGQLEDNYGERSNVLMRSAFAENFAAKSNSFTSDKQMKYRNWLIIANARALRGDKEGMQEAQVKAEKLR